MFPLPKPLLLLQISFRPQASDAFRPIFRKSVLLKHLQRQHSQAPSQPITRRPELHPPLVKMAAFAVKPEVGAQPRPSFRVLIHRASVDGVRVVEDDIACLVRRYQPNPPSTVLVPGVEVGRVLGKLAVLLHVHVEGALPFLRRQVGCLAREVVFDGTPETCRVGEVDEAAAGGTDIAYW